MSLTPGNESILPGQCALLLLCRPDDHALGCTCCMLMWLQRFSVVSMYSLFIIIVSDFDIIYINNIKFML